jgi:glycosyltransferase involved in cell wall biosynthesis
MKTAFLTTIFSTEEQYLYDFFDSLQNQTNTNFDVVVINDGYKDFEKIKTAYKQSLNILEYQYSNTPAKNREYGINYCIENCYDVLVFGDIDDFFAENRVEKSIEFLAWNDIVVNDLSLFDQDGVYEKMYISKRIENRTHINVDFIKDKNIFGLSNTAILLKDIKKIEISDDLIAADWYLFTLFLLKNKKAIFTNETETFYRQHKDNIVGMKKLSKEALQRGIDVKSKHYRQFANVTNFFDKELLRVENKNMSFDNKKEIKNPLWWELI